MFLIKTAGNNTIPTLLLLIKVTKPKGAGTCLPVGRWAALPQKGAKRTEE